MKILWTRWFLVATKVCELCPLLEFCSIEAANLKIFIRLTLNLQMYTSILAFICKISPKLNQQTAYQTNLFELTAGIKNLRVN